MPKRRLRQSQSPVRKRPRAPHNATSGDDDASKSCSNRFMAGWTVAVSTLANQQQNCCSEKNNGEQDRQNHGASTCDGGGNKIDNDDVKIVWTYKSLSDLCVRAGAKQISSQVHRKVRCVVATPEAVLQHTQRVRKGWKLGIPIVPVAWVYERMNNKSNTRIVDDKMPEIPDPRGDDGDPKRKHDKCKRNSQAKATTDSSEPVNPVEWSEPVSYGCCCVCHEDDDDDDDNGHADEDPQQPTDCAWCADCSVNVQLRKVL